MASSGRAAGFQFTLFRLEYRPMAISVYLVKRPLKEKRRNGQHKYRWALRWKDPSDPTGRKFCCESTGTADRTQAEGMQKAKWAVLNGLADDPWPQPVAESKPGPAWDECR